MVNFLSRLIYSKLRSPIVTNSLWNIGGKVVTIFIAPLFTILIARILQPEDYGVYGIAFAIITFIDIIKDLGISQAIIIEKEKHDYISLQFTLQLGLGVIFYVVILLASYFIADFYKVAKLQLVLNLYALIIFIWVLEFPLVTDYLKENNYELLFYRQIIPSILFGLIAFILANLRFGVYSLVLGQLASRLITALFLLQKTVWKPKLYFNYQIFRKLFILGKHILIQSFSGFLVSSADALVIGKNLGAVKLGFYRMGMNLTNLIPNAIVPQIQQVVFTELSDNTEYLRKRYAQFNLIVGSASFFISLVIFVAAPYLIPLILGKKWEAIVPITQIISVTLPTAMIVGINNDISKILNFTHIYSYYSVIRSVTTLSTIFIASYISLHYVLLAWCLISLITCIANDFLFFRFQKIIPLDKIKITIYVFSLIWATYVLTKLL